MNPDIEFKNAPNCIKEFVVDKDTGKITPVFTDCIYGDPSNLSNNSLRKGDEFEIIWLGSLMTFLAIMPTILLLQEFEGLFVDVISAALISAYIVSWVYCYKRSVSKKAIIENRLSRNVKPHTVFSHFEMWEVGDNLNGDKVFYDGVYPNGDIALAIKEFKTSDPTDLYRINPQLLFELCGNDVNNDLNKRLKNMRVSEMRPNENNTYMSWLECFRKSLIQNNNENLISGHRRSAQFNELGNAEQSQPRNAPVAVES